MEEIRRGLLIALSVALVLGIAFWIFNQTRLWGFSENNVIWTDDVASVVTATEASAAEAPAPRRIQADLFHVRRSAIMTEDEFAARNGGSAQPVASTRSTRSTLDIVTEGTMSLGNLGDAPEVDFSQLSAPVREIQPVQPIVVNTAQTVTETLRAVSETPAMMVDAALDPILRVEGFNFARVEAALASQPLTPVERLNWIPALRTAQSNPVVLREKLNQIRERLGLMPL